MENMKKIAVVGALIIAGVAAYFAVEHYRTKQDNVKIQGCFGLGIGNGCVGIGNGPHDQENYESRNNQSDNMSNDDMSNDDMSDDSSAE